MDLCNLGLGATLTGKYCQLLGCARVTLFKLSASTFVQKKKKITAVAANARLISCSCRNILY